MLENVLDLAKFWIFLFLTEGFVFLIYFLDLSRYFDIKESGVFSVDFV